MDSKLQERQVKALEDISRSLAIMEAIFNAMVTEGLVVLPDTPASDN